MGVGMVYVTTQFYWPAPPSGLTAGYTAPLVRWGQTQITGLCSYPIVLSGYFSQTYMPEHHNFSEHFLFEPQLDPGVSASILEELRSRDIRLIHVYRGYSSTTLTTYGYRARADLNDDGHIDENDFALFKACETGAALDQTLPWGCRSADLDRDQDVDQEDFGFFQRCYTGLVLQRDTHCAD